MNDYWRYDVRIQVTSNDVSLFHLAVRHFGDAMQWWRIAEMNALDDSDLTGFDVPVQLVIPDESRGDERRGLPPS